MLDLRLSMIRQKQDYLANDLSEEDSIQKACQPYIIKGQFLLNVAPSCSLYTSFHERQKLTPAKKLWTKIRLLIRSVSKWKKISLEAVMSQMNQKHKQNHPFYHIQSFFHKEISVSILQKVMKARQSYATTYFHFISSLYQLLDNLTCPSSWVPLLQLIMTSQELQYTEPLKGSSYNTLYHIRHTLHQLFQLILSRLKKSDCFYPTSHLSCYAIVWHFEDEEFLCQNQIIEFLSSYFSTLTSKFNLSRIQLICFKLFSSFCYQLGHIKKSFPHSEHPALDNVINILYQQLSKCNDLIAQARTLTKSQQSKLESIASHQILSNELLSVYPQIEYSFNIPKPPEPVHGEFTLSFTLFISNELESNIILCSRGNLQQKLYVPCISLSKDRSIILSFTSGKNTETLYSTNKVNLDQWTMITVSVQDRQATLYLNNFMSGQTKLSHPLPQDQCPFNVIFGPKPSNQFFESSITGTFPKFYIINPLWSWDYWSLHQIQSIYSQSICHHDSNPNPSPPISWFETIEYNYLSIMEKFPDSVYSHLSDQKWILILFKILSNSSFSLQRLVIQQLKRILLVYSPQKLISELPFNFIQFLFSICRPSFWFFNESVDEMKDFPFFPVITDQNKDNSLSEEIVLLFRSLASISEWRNILSPFFIQQIEQLKKAWPNLESIGSQLSDITHVLYIYGACHPRLYTGSYCSFKDKVYSILFYHPNTNYSLIGLESNIQWVETKQIEPIRRLHLEAQYLDIPSLFPFFELIIQQFPAFISSSLTNNEHEHLIMICHIISSFITIFIEYINSFELSQFYKCLSSLLYMASLPINIPLISYHQLFIQQNYLWQLLRPTSLSNKNIPSATVPILTSEEISQNNMVESMCVMGFPEFFCREALKNNQWNVEKAMNWLLSHIDELESMNEPSQPNKVSDDAILYPLPRPSMDEIKGWTDHFDSLPDKNFEIEEFFPKSEDNLPLSISSPNFSNFTELLKIFLTNEHSLCILQCRYLLSLLFSKNIDSFSLELLKSPDTLIRFTKLFFFRQSPSILSQIDWFKNLIKISPSDYKDNSFIFLLLNESISHLIHLSGPKYPKIRFDNNNQSMTDIECLTSPRFEWSIASLHLLFQYHPNCGIISSDIFSSIYFCLRSSNLFFKERIMILLSDYLHFLQLSSQHDININSLPITRLEKLGSEINVLESNRFLHSQFSVSLFQLLSSVTLYLSFMYIQKPLDIIHDINPPNNLVLEDRGDKYLFLSWSTTHSYPTQLRYRCSNSTNWEVLDHIVCHYAFIDNLIDDSTYFIQLRSYKPSIEDKNELKEKDEKYSIWSPLFKVNTSGLTWHLIDNDQQYLHLTDHKQTLSLHCQSEKWCTVTLNRSFNKGIHSWTIKINKTKQSFLFFGVVRKGFNRESFVGGDNLSWGLFCSDHARYHNRNKSKGGAKYGDTSIKQGMIVTITLNCDNGSLIYNVNGKNWGTAWSDLPKNTAFYPAVSLYHKNDKISISSPKNDDKTLTDDKISQHDDIYQEMTINILPKSSVESTVKDFAVCSSMGHWFLESFRNESHLLHHGDTSTHLIPHLPPSFVEQCFSFYQHWRTVTNRCVQTPEASIIVNVEHPLLTKNQLKYGDCINCQQGRAYVLGVNQDDQIMIKVNGNNFATILTEVDSIKKISSRYRRVFETKENDLDSFSLDEFIKEIHNPSWKNIHHSNLIQLCDRLANELNISIFDLLYLDLYYCVPDDVLKKFSPSQLCIRFSLLFFWNNHIMKILPYLSENEKWGYSTICYQLNYIRHLIFPSISLDYVNHLIRVTSTYTRPSEDSYDDPPDLTLITFNRHKAAKALEKGSPASILKYSMFGQAFSQLAMMKASNLRRNWIRMLDDGQERTFKVRFEGEGVADNGGPYRDCFNECFIELLSEESKLPLFIPSPNHRNNDGEGRDLFIPNPSCYKYELFSFVGRLIGICIRNRIHIQLSFPLLFWTQLLDIEADYHLLGEIDIVFHRQMNEIEKTHLEKEKDSVMAEEIFSSIYPLEFVCNLGDGNTQVELIQDGKNHPVTLNNRHQYIRLMRECRLNESQTQISHIRKGLTEIIPKSSLHYLIPSQFELRVCGNKDYSIDLLRQVTLYEGVNESAFYIQYFWDVLEEFTPQQRSSFLRFVWARTRMPPTPSQFHTKFKLLAPPPQSVYDPDSHFPHAHTCFFQLSLPVYTSKDILKAKLLYAIEHCGTMDSDVKLNDSEIYNWQLDDIK